MDGNILPIVNWCYRDSYYSDTEYRHAIKEVAKAKHNYIVCYWVNDRKAYDICTFDRRFFGFRCISDGSRIIYSNVYSWSII